MYECDENGDWEGNVSEDDEDAKEDRWDSEKKHGKVIVDSDDEDDKPSSSMVECGRGAENVYQMRSGVSAIDEAFTRSI